MKIYAVKVDRCAYDTGRYTRTEVVGYYADEKKADKKVAKIKKEKDITICKDNGVYVVIINVIE